MALRPDETDLIGKWIKPGERIVGDQVEQRIHDLITHQLKKIALDPQFGAWQVLYQDPNDGRYWELTYPNGGVGGRAGSLMFPRHSQLQNIGLQLTKREAHDVS